LIPPHPHVAGAFARQATPASAPRSLAHTRRALAMPFPVCPALPLTPWPQEQLDQKLQQRQARETGICPIREELYAQCFGAQRAPGLLSSSACGEPVWGPVRRGVRPCVCTPACRVYVSCLPCARHHHPPGGCRRTHSPGHNQLRRAGPAAAACAGRDSHDHRGVPNPVRIQVHPVRVSGV
jgi:hypothetical protein